MSVRLRFAARQLAFLFVLFLATSPVWAQVGYYTFSQDTVPYRALAGGTVLGNASNDDEIFADSTITTNNGYIPNTGYPIGFTLNYNNRPYNVFGVNTNGWITLGNRVNGRGAVIGGYPNNLSFTPMAAPDTIPNNIIAGFGADLAGATGASLRFVHGGTAPNRTLTVQWTSYRRYRVNGDNISFKIILEEGTDIIRYHYGLCNATQGGATIEVGLRGASPTDYHVRTSSVVQNMWGSTIYGSPATASLSFSDINRPPNGLRFSFTPQVVGQCPLPRNLQITGLTSQSAYLSFLPYPNAPISRVGYGPAGGPYTYYSLTYPDSAINLFGLQSGRDYTVTVRPICTLTDSADAPASITFTTPPPNDECAQVALLLAGTDCFPTIVRMRGAREEATTPNAACGGNGSPDVWFKVGIPAAGAVRVSTSADSSAPNPDTVLELFLGGCDSLYSIGCSDDVNYPTDATSAITVGGRVGDTILVRARFYNADTGRFAICAQAIPNYCGPPANLAATLVNANTGRVTFGAGYAATSYRVTYYSERNPADSVSSIRSRADSVYMRNLRPATRYIVKATSICSAIDGTARALTSLETAPYNDNPADADTVSLLTTCLPLRSSNIGATTTPPAGYTNPPANQQCSRAQNPTDVWFTFRTAQFLTPGANIVSISVAGPTAGAVRLFAARNGNGPFTEIACSGAQNGAAPELRVGGLTPETEYFISVAGYVSNDNTNDFTICVVGLITLGVAPTLASSIMHVYPNPTQGGNAQLYSAAFAGLPSLHISAYNALGQAVLQADVKKQATDTQATAPTAGLPPGIYNIKVEAASGTYQARLAVGE